MEKISSLEKEVNHHPYGGNDVQDKLSWSIMTENGTAPLNSIPESATLENPITSLLCFHFPSSITNERSALSWSPMAYYNGALIFERTVDFPQKFSELEDGTLGDIDPGETIEWTNKYVTRALGDIFHGDTMEWPRRP
ncbi:hypothetical protein MKW92_053434 [Papaver armeniacum]|nr:hypothetical protein MKW92_053434 [Papaver armeniacum]